MRRPSAVEWLYTGKHCVSCFKEGAGGNLGVCRHCVGKKEETGGCLLYTSPSPRDLSTSRMPSSA